MYLLQLVLEHCELQAFVICPSGVVSTQNSLWTQQPLSHTQKRRLYGQAESSQRAQGGLAKAVTRVICSLTHLPAI